MVLYVIVLSFTRTASDAMGKEDSDSDSYSDPPSLDLITPFDTHTFNYSHSINGLEPFFP
jgi:hypothetical protein